MKDLEHTSEEDFDGIMRLNVKGPYFLAQVPSIYYLEVSNANTLLAESSTSHTFGLLYCLDLDVSMHRFDRNARLPALQRNQRRHRADDSRHVEGPGRQRYLR